ncbi:MAG: hypothetical protein OEO77_14700, partial [Acidimicrobiia bacterium]|nr:hypothetical protein [Acidimicrobiia bacterium]
VVDFTANRRTDEALLDAFPVPIARITAGDDVSVVLNDSKSGNDASNLVLATVNLYDPGTSYYRYMFPTGFIPPPAVTDTGPLDPCAGGNCGSGSGRYETHFRPDGTNAGLTLILRAFGVITGDIDSTYNMAEVRSGDNIQICHVSTTGEDSQTCPTTEINDATHVVTADPLPDKIVNININTDADWGPNPAVELDDGIAIDVPQILVWTNGNIDVTELVGDLLAGHIHSTLGDVELTSPQRILDANRIPTIDVTGENITMTAGTLGDIGGIGLPGLPNPNSPNPADVDNLGGFLEVNVDVNNNGGALTATDTDANDTQTKGIYLDELTGNLRINEIWTEGNAVDLTTGNVSLRTVNGSIVDANDDDFWNVRGQTIDIDANGGSIGEVANDLDIDSSRASSAPCTTDSCLGTAADHGYGDLDPGLEADNDDVALEASVSIYVAEIDGYLRLLLAHAATGDIRIKVRETSDLDEDLYLIEDGTARFAESNVRAPDSDPDAERDVPVGQIFAEVGNITLLVGDDIVNHPVSEILANGNISIYGDSTGAALSGSDADVTYGTRILLRGRIAADCVVTAGAPGAPVGSCAQETGVTPGASTFVYGHLDVDLIQFGDASGDPFVTDGGGTDQGDNGYVLLDSRTRAFGSDVLDALSDNDEDTFLVYFLQTMDVGSGQVTTAPGAGHTLTLDGRDDTDTYRVFTTGSDVANARNYVVNILDTGAPNDGADEGFIHGHDSTNDLFLLRRSRCIDTQAGYGLDAAGECVSPTETADRPGFVALLHGTPDLYNTQIPPAGQPTDVQRINYDTGLNGRLNVFGFDGDDTYFSDDTSVIVTLDGGAGADDFQVGQIFGTHRTTFTGFLVAPFSAAGGNVAPADTFPGLVATTRGWLSPGIGAPMVVLGGTGNDEFTVYSNQAELRLEGGDDNDIFTIRAFALAAVCNTDVTGDGDCTV